MRCRLPPIVTPPPLHIVAMCLMLLVTDRGLGRPDLAADAKAHAKAAATPLQLLAQKMYSYWDASGEQVASTWQRGAICGAKSLSTMRSCLQ